MNAIDLKIASDITTQPIFQEDLFHMVFNDILFAQPNSNKIRMTSPFYIAQNL
jgi:hypothetical protein